MNKNQLIEEAAEEAILLARELGVEWMDGAGDGYMMAAASRILAAKIMVDSVYASADAITGRMDQ